jgi:hypothetical protein
MMVGGDGGFLELRGQERGKGRMSEAGTGRTVRHASVDAYGIFLRVVEIGVLQSLALASLSAESIKRTFLVTPDGPASSRGRSAT